jgi:hypothetical protein
VIQAYLKEQDDSLAEVADTDDDEIPMRSLTPDARVSTVYPLLAKESVKEVAPNKGPGAAAPPPSAKTNSASSGTTANKISDKDDIFEIYRKIKN